MATNIWKKEDSWDEREKKIATAIEEFSDSYFAPPSGGDEWATRSECGEKWIRYITNKDLDADKKHCSHPKTYALLEVNNQSQHIAY